MASKRKLLRQTIVKLLKGNTDVGDNVFANRPTPLWECELPAICVYIKTEPTEEKVTAPKVYSRNASVVVDILALANDNCDDILDDIQEQVEEILFSNRYLLDPDDKVERLDAEIKLVSTDMDLYAEGDKIAGSNRITFTASYDTEAPEQKDSGLDEFKTGDAQYEINESAEAEDRFTIPQ